MKTNLYRKTILFDLILLTALVLSACGGQANTPPTAAIGTSSPTIEPSPTSSPTLSPTPTPFPPVQIGTPLPVSVLSPITAENITRLRQVAIYGERIEGVFSPDGSRMLEIHPGIVNVIDTESQKLIGHVDYQTLLGYNDDGTYFFIKDDKGYAVVTLDGQRKDLPQLDNINELPSLELLELFRKMGNRWPYPILLILLLVIIIRILEYLLSILGIKLPPSIT